MDKRTHPVESALASQAQSGTAKRRGRRRVSERVGGRFGVPNDRPNCDEWPNSNSYPIRCHPALDSQSAPDCKDRPNSHYYPTERCHDGLHN